VVSDRGLELKVGEFLLREFGAPESSPDSNGKPDRVGFAPAEPLDEPDDPVGNSVFFL